MNSYSLTDVANMAVAHLQNGIQIQDVTTEQSPQANACRTFIANAIASTLRDFAWPFATAYQTLALVSTFPSNQGYPYTYSYRRPTDCVTIRKIMNGLRQDNLWTLIPFTESSDASGGLVLTDLVNATLEYTAYIDNPALWTDDFVMALSFKLAGLIGPVITGGDPFKVAQGAEARYFQFISQARANALNEQQLGPQLDSEFVLARDEGSGGWW